MRLNTPTITLVASALPEALRTVALKAARSVDTATLTVMPHGGALIQVYKNRI